MKIRRAMGGAMVIALLMGLAVGPASADSRPDNPWNGINGAEKLDTVCDAEEDPFIKWVYTSPHTGVSAHTWKLVFNGEDITDYTTPGHGKVVQFTTDYHPNPSAEAFIWLFGRWTSGSGGLVISEACGPAALLGEVTVEKDWVFGEGTDGREDLGDLEATFTIRKDGTVLQDPVVDGYAFEDLPLGTLIEVVGESVAGLPDDCGYQHDGYAGKAWTVTETAPTGTITLTNTVTCDEPDLVTITLQKAWFDEAGVEVEDPEVDYQIDLTVFVDEADVVMATLPGNPMAELEMGGRYGVQEVATPEGWEAVACPDPFPAEFAPVAMNTSAISVALGAPDGSFAANQSGIHVVCNQEVAETTTTTATVGIRLIKLWFDADGAPTAAPEGDWTATLTAGGTVQATAEEGAPSDWASLTDGGSYTVAEDATPAGWDEVDCDDVTLPDIGTSYLDVSGTGGPFTADAEGAHAVCNQAAVAVLGQVIEAEPEVTVEAETEVLAETRETLPVTGTNAAALALAGLLAVGVGTRLTRWQR